MTRTSTAKIEFRRWKAHTCVGCGGQYAYLMVRKLAYGGSTPERATEKAQAAAERAMVRDVDRQPCPTCGLYQPDMIAGRRRSLHRWMLLAALLAAGLVAGLYLGDVIQADRALLAAMAEVAVIGRPWFSGGSPQSQSRSGGQPPQGRARDRRPAGPRVAAGNAAWRPASSLPARRPTACWPWPWRSLPCWPWPCRS